MDFSVLTIRTFWHTFSDFFGKRDLAKVLLRDGQGYPSTHISGLGPWTAPLVLSGDKDVWELREHYSASDLPLLLEILSEKTKGETL
ncbi:MAG: hypothetical protein OXC13_18380 [Caldilineaceae bacterium]|nr:hypothetical protein [Caldilineaceae bacterium]